jgi:hypothetical protein
MAQLTKENKDVIYSKQYYDKKKLPIPKLESEAETSSQTTSSTNKK